MTTTTPQAALLSDDEIEQHFENNKSAPGRELRRLIGRSIEAAILAKLQATQAEPVHKSFASLYEAHKDGIAEQAAILEAELAQPVQASDKWEGAEEWMPLAWELCADECGEEACTELIWEGGPIPEPWGDRWLKYEDEAKRLIALVRKHIPSVAVQPVQAGELPDEREAFEAWRKTMQDGYNEWDAWKARAALAARKPLTGLTREQMEAGRHQVFSTNNPFCPCDSKTFRKVAEWTEREFCRINGPEVKP